MFAALGMYSMLDHVIPPQTDDENQTFADATPLMEHLRSSLSPSLFSFVEIVHSWLTLSDEALAEELRLLSDAEHPHHLVVLEAILKDRREGAKKPPTLASFSPSSASVAATSQLQVGSICWVRWRNFSNEQDIMGEFKWRVATVTSLVSER